MLVLVLMVVVIPLLSFRRKQWHKSASYSTLHINVSTGERSPQLTSSQAHFTSLNTSILGTFQTTTEKFAMQLYLSSRLSHVWLTFARGLVRGEYARLAKSASVSLSLAFCLLSRLPVGPHVETLAVHHACTGVRGW